MIAVLLAGSLWWGGRVMAAAPAPEDLFRDANAAYEAGDLAGAEAKLEPFRGKFASHRLAWPANLLWARCTTDPAESERRFRLLAGTAPPETKRECELAVAHLLMIRNRNADAERAYADFLAANADDERAEEAAYWRAVCLRALGREPEAEPLAEREMRGGRQDRWRAFAGLLLGSIRLGRKDLAGARAVYAELAANAWAEDVRPQALLGAAKSSRNGEEAGKAARALVRDFPDSPEAAEARALVHPLADASASGPASVSAPASRRWGVQVGAFAQAGNAAVERRKWTKEGRKVVVLKRHHETFGELFLVYLGPYPTREQAEAVAKELKAGGAECRVGPL
jgi:cell division septation protein DedD